MSIQTIANKGRMPAIIMSCSTLAGFVPEPDLVTVRLLKKGRELKP